MNFKTILEFFKTLLGKPTKKLNRKKSSGMLYAKNDSIRIKKELIALKDKNRPLYDLIIDLYEWVDLNLEKDTVMTMIFRTQEEQEDIYGSETSKKSPHQFNHAVDIRSWLYTKEEQEQMVEYMNAKYNSSNYYKWTAKVHEVSNRGVHFHIQYYKTS